MLGIYLGQGRLFCFALSSDSVHYPSGRPNIRGLVSGMLTFVLGVALRRCRVPRTSLLFHSLIIHPSVVGVGDKYILGLVGPEHLVGFVAGHRPIV